MSQEKTIAFFDFDGTITTSDTMFAFFKFAKGTVGYYGYFLLLSPVFILFVLKLIPGQWAKEISLKLLFGGIDRADFNRIGSDFALTQIDALVRPKAWERILWHRVQGHEIYIVSASAQEWLRPWADSKQIPLICTYLKYNNEGKFTGKIDGKNCNEDEKVRRIKEEINLSEYKTVYAYGDTSGDKAMLAMATHGEFKPFR